jgi:Fe-S cluster assembly iron-binding protein IscA
MTGRQVCRQIMEKAEIQVQPEAAALLQARLAEAGIPQGGLRIGFLYGCGGSGYRLTLAEAPLPGDRTYVVEQVKVFADAVAAESLAGARLVLGEGELTLDHPDAVLVEYCG